MLSRAFSLRKSSSSFSVLHSDRTWRKSCSFSDHRWGVSSLCFPLCQGTTPDHTTLEPPFPGLPLLSSSPHMPSTFLYIFQVYTQLRACMRTHWKAHMG